MPRSLQRLVLHGYKRVPYHKRVLFFFELFCLADLIAFLPSGKIALCRNLQSKPSISHSSANNYAMWSNKNIFENF